MQTRSSPPTSRRKSRGRPQLRFIAATLVAIASTTAATAQETHEAPVRFEAGATSARISDSLAVGDTLLYRLGAEAGQRMTASLEASEPAMAFTVYPPGVVPGDAATPIEGPGAPLARAVRQFDATLSASGEYMIAVSIKGAGAASAGTSDFTLEVAVTGALGETVSGDFADGLQGGPDRWRVRAAGGLNLRADPSIGAEVLMLMPDRTVVRNLGCRMAEARRWCQVALPEPGPEGWAAGDYLVEAGGD